MTENTLPKVTILLYSKESPSNSIRVVQGHSGKTYGHARFNPKEGRMECRFTQEQFTQKVAEDIEANKHRSFCKWVTWFEFETPEESESKNPCPNSPPAPVVVISSEVAPIDPEKSIKREVSEETNPNPLDSLPPALEPLPEGWEQLSFRGLRSLALKRGIANVEAINKSADLIAALRAPAP